MSTPISDGLPDLPPIDPSILTALKGLPSDFDGFARIFQDEIRPALMAREGERLNAAIKAKKSTQLGIAVGVIGALTGLLAFKMPQLAMIAGMIGFGIHGAGRRPLARIGREAKALLVEPVASKLALTFTPEPGPQATINDIRRVGLVSGWDRDNYEDRVTGTRHGTDFEFFEAHLEERRTTRDSNGRTQTRWVTVFRGQCMRFKFHKTFHGRTLVTRDAGIFNRFGGGKGMQRARLESAKFEKAFEVYTTDQVESRFLLTPDLMQRLVDLETVFHGGGLRCAFEGGEMFIAVEGADLFEPGSMFTPLDNPDRIRELLDDFGALFHLMDAVSAERPSSDDDDKAPDDDKGGTPFGKFRGQT